MHKTVLLHEAVNALVMAPSGQFVDGTFGRGGHARAILSTLSASGRLLGIDKDAAAEIEAAALASEDPRFDFYRGSFADMPVALAERGIDAVDGILLDLGVSSPQLDDHSRGFSFQGDGPLDMRMDREHGLTAAEWLAQAPEAEIAKVLWEYGEERFSRRMAAAIVAARQQAPIETTARLAAIVSEANPRWERHKHPATRAFQAIRIFINRELEDLEAFLAHALQLLRTGGRLVIISFHSLEDRLVKRFMRDAARGPALPAGLPVTDASIPRSLRVIGKAVRAGEAEVQENPRARSAIMRVAEKLA